MGCAECILAFSDLSVFDYVNQPPMYFPTTQWTLLAQATLGGETAGRQAMEDLCRRYWSPLYQFIRARGYNEAEAKDLTQEFLLHLVEHSTLQKADRSRGKFRSFLCGALVRFLADAYDKRQAQKRGGGAPHVELDVAEELGASSSPDELVFDREWAMVILENALRTVEEQYKGAENQFAILRQFLPGSIAVPSYEQAATQLGLNLPALKSELHRLRQRFKAAVREEVAATVSAPHEIDQEMNHLQHVLMNKGIDWEIRRKLSSPDS
jgi:RNA polymerase sigma factor (sigma-70 family)